MKKRMISLLMVLAMVVGMCIPVSATEIGPETLELIPVENVDTSVAIAVINDDISAHEAMPIEEDYALQDEVSADAATYAIRNTVTPKQIHINPIVLNIQTAEAFIINNISRSAYWPNGAQYESLFLSPDEVNAFVMQISNALITNPDTSASTWAIIGWYVDAIVGLTAERPRRVEFAPAFYPSGTNYESQTLTVNSQSVDLHVTQEFYFTPNINPEEYYYVGFEGDFYYIYTSGNNQGKEGGTSFTIGVAMNTKAT